MKFWRRLMEDDKNLYQQVVDDFMKTGAINWNTATTEQVASMGFTIHRETIHESESIPEEEPIEIDTVSKGEKRMFEFYGKKFVV